ncbi:CsbD family protein [Pseudomonas syringae]|uniref:CsbD family protein n=1 Tax=Pseudomonas syringae TaxID=317 RepID=UPI001F2B568F|nr:CsbD family protein [Pseudomonas syringae]MCF5710383.1 CsbD family protein [Pseudomonas syringae]
MKSEQVEGVAEKLVGKAQSAVGRLLGDSQLEAEGTGRQASGQLTKTYGDTGSISFFVFGLVRACRQAGRCFTSSVW